MKPDRNTHDNSIPMRIRIPTKVHNRVLTYAKDCTEGNLSRAITELVEAGLDGVPRSLDPGSSLKEALFNLFPGLVVNQSPNQGGFAPIRLRDGSDPIQLILRRRKNGNL